ncbi:hypothetical protein Unana1_04700 [Umbelopsis nana]
MDQLQFGDLFWIYNSDGHVLSCNDQNYLVFIDPATTNVDDQLLLYCGHKSKPYVFYLTFKYKAGFLSIDDQEKLFNGVPFFDRGVFTLESFGQALGQPYTVTISDHEH